MSWNADIRHTLQIPQGANPRLEAAILVLKQYLGQPIEYRIQGT